LKFNNYSISNSKLNWFVVVSCFAEAKENVKGVAAKGVESAKEGASKVADKGHGKRNLIRLFCVSLFQLCMPMAPLFRC
jgi:hypothetical protein